MPASISDLEGLVPGFAAGMKKAGMRTTGRLLETARSLRGRQTLAEKTDIAKAQLRQVANLIDAGGEDFLLNARPDGPAYPSLGP